MFKNDLTIAFCSVFACGPAFLAVYVVTRVARESPSLRETLETLGKEWGSLLLALSALTIVLASIAVSRVRRIRSLFEVGDLVIGRCSDDWSCWRSFVRIPIHRTTSFCIKFEYQGREIHGHVTVNRRLIFRSLLEDGQRVRVFVDPVRPERFAVATLYA